MEDDVSKLYDWSVKWKMMGVDYMIGLLKIM